MFRHWETLLERREFTLKRRGRFLVAELAVPHQVLATSVINGGHTDRVRFLLNHQSCEGAGHHDVQHLILEIGDAAYHARICAEASLPPEATAMMGTAANMNYAAVTTGAAARLVVTVISGVDAVEASQLAGASRREAAEEIDRISQEISLLRMKQSPLLFDLEEYVIKVREGTLGAEHRQRAWRSVLSGITDVTPIIRTTLGVVEGSRWLKIALKETDRVSLRQVLLGREDLLGRLAVLEAPSAPEDIERLDGMTKFYRQLMQSLDQLNAALLHVTDRLKGP